MATPSAHLLNSSFANSPSSASAISSNTSQRRMPSKLVRHVLTVSLFLVVLGAALPSWATTYTVTSTADSGTGSLRAALGMAATGDTINFSLTYPATITLTSGSLLVGTDVTISGPGPAKLFISGGGNSTVFSLNGVTAAISGVTVENASSGGFGGGIYNYGGTLTVSNSTLSGNSTILGIGVGGGGIDNPLGAKLMVINSTFSGNSAPDGYGGAILNDGTLTVINSTFSGNSAVSAGAGGAIYNTGSATVSFSTFSGNSGSYGGGILNAAGTLTLKSTLLAGQTSGVNCDLAGGTATSDGYNLSDDSSCTFLTATGDQNDVTKAATYLGPLANNGSSTTQTIALLTGSTAINAIPVTPVNECTDAFGNPVTTDQRGVLRPQGTGCDIGAYELILSPQVSASPSSVNFDDVELCRTKTALLALHDNDATVVQIGPISWIDVTGNQSDFSFRTYSTTGILGPGKGRSYQIQVKFSPSEEIPESATLNIVTNAPGSPVQVQITGTGIKGPKGCDLNP